MPSLPMPFPSRPVLRAGAARCALAGALLLAAAASQAQSVAADRAAQIRYERQIEACNQPDRPAPERRACIRAAGAALDRVTGGPSSDVQTTSEDGRATILAPAGIGSREGDPSDITPQTRTSGDGRSTVLIPSDSTLRGAAVR
ncbi:MAG: hypothetical protein PGN26_11975 [Xylophilus ampelinus]